MNKMNWKWTLVSHRPGRGDRATGRWSQQKPAAVATAATADPLPNPILQPRRKVLERHLCQVDDLFAQWDSNPLQLFSVPGLGP